MRLYVIRHGKAERDSATGRDEDRPLKPKGIRQSQWLGEQLAAAGKHKPELIVSSPLARAVDTARAVHQAVRCPLEFADALSTHSTASEILKLVESKRAIGSLVIVGHNPLLEELIAAIISSGSAEPPVMQTGAAAVIDLKNGASLIASGKLVAMLREPGDGD